MKLERLPFLLVSMVVRVATAQSNVDPTQKLAWCENIGWTNWRDAGDGGDGVRVGFYFLAGFIWSENVGWINVGDGSPGGDCGGRPCYANIEASDFGVNVSEDGLLQGKALGENIGWINFDTAAPDRDGARFDACTHQFFGYAWGENIGWMNLADVTHFLALGPCPFADGDCDQDVDLEDARRLLGLIGGPGALADCPAFGGDEDGDVDLLDVAEFLVRFEGG